MQTSIKDSYVHRHMCAVKMSNDVFGLNVIYVYPPLPLA